MKKTDFFGAGPRIGRIVLPYLGLAIALSLLFPYPFAFPEGARTYTMIAGAGILVPGLVLYAHTARLLLKGLKETRLVTTGLYRYSQNPLYAVIILFILPGAGLMLNSWLVLTTPVVGYLVFKSCIRREYDELTEVFGDAYLEYRKKTPEFFPFFPKG